MAKKYRIHLSAEEREQLHKIVKAGKAAATKRQRAQILLAADASKASGELRDEDIAKVLDVSIATVERTRCALCEHGLEVAVHGWPPHRKAPRTKLDGWAEAPLVAATCSPPPEGAARWTLKLLGDHLVGLGLVASVRNPTIGRALKKTLQNPGRWSSGTCHRRAAPPSSVRWRTCSRFTAAREMKNARWCASMSFASSSSLMCASHSPRCQGWPHGWITSMSGAAGAAHSWCYAPLEKWRGVRVTGQRTAQDWAQTIKWLCDEVYPQAERIVLVQDHLNTHTPASLYEAFTPEEAMRLKERMEWHYTPKHGSWLNMAEIEIGVAQHQCLDRRSGDQATLEKELQAWGQKRNEAHCGTDWQFTTEDARIKLKRLYPSTLLT